MTTAPQGPGRPSRWRTLPLAARQSLLVAAVVAASLCVVAALAVQLTRSHLRRDLDRDLEAVVASFEAGPAREITAPDGLADAAREWLAGAAHPADRLVVVHSISGEVLSTRSELELRDVAGGTALLTASESRWASLAGGSVRALAVPLTFEGEQTGTLVAAASTDAIEETSAALLRQVLIAAGVGFAVAVALATAAVRRSLHPLERMAAEIEAIQAADDLSRRVRFDGSEDEVGRLGNAFNRTLGRLEHAFASQRQFVADASHELRTPLTVARGQVELLRGAAADDDARRSFGLALDELDRMGRIVQDLLLLARLDEGLPLSREPVEVELTIEEALLRVPGVKRADVEVVAEPGLVADADGERLLQVLVNLLGNAVSHGGHGTGISVTTRREGDHVVLDVADDGPGIAKEDLPHVFDRFYRGTPARSNQAAGAGLGLAIVRTLVERMGGTASAASPASPAGGGAVFTVGLPVWSDGAEP